MDAEKVALREGLNAIIHIASMYSRDRDAAAAVALGNPHWTDEGKRNVVVLACEAIRRLDCAYRALGIDRDQTRLGHINRHLVAVHSGHPCPSLSADVATPGLASGSSCSAASALAAGNNLTGAGNRPHTTTEAA